MKLYKNHLIIFFLSGLLGIFISSCAAHAPRQTVVAGDETMILREGMMANNQLPKAGKPTPLSINKDLLPDIPLPQTGLIAKSQHRFDMRVQNAPARAFFASLVKGTPYSVVVSPEIQGNITLDLKRVTIAEAMDAVRDSYGYEYQVTPYGFRVSVPTIQTKIYHINYLDVHRFGRSETSINPGINNSNNNSNNNGQNLNSSTNSSINNNGDNNRNGAGSSSNVTTLSNTDFWTGLQTALSAIVGKEGGHSVIVNPQSGIVIVSALPGELRQIEKYLISSQLIMNRQVILEAKILEVQLDAGYESGINWSLLGLQQEGNQKISDDIKQFTSIFTLHATGDANFNLVLKALQTQGKVKVLSSPRISTVNNQKAVIKVGTDQYFVVNVSSNVANSIGGLNTTQNVDLEPFFSGIALDVTPQIDRQGNVTLHVHPVVSQVTGNEIAFTLNGKVQTIPSARTAIRESDSIVHARDGQIVVIGGLMQNSMSEHQGSTPIVDRIPVLRGLFQDKRQNSSRTELVILLRPILVKNNEWNDDMRRSAKDYQEMNCDTYDYQVQAPV